MNARTRSVVTFAMGKPVYIELAVNLARSFVHWHAQSDILFYIIADQPVVLPSDLSSVKLIQVSPGRYGTGFSPKLWLDELAPTDQTLFVDSDCLCFSSLESVFARFSGRAVAVIGTQLTHGNFFGDISSLRERLNLSWIPTFVGAVYYIERGPSASAIYQHARELERDYDALGLVRLRGMPNEEPLMALAMASHDLSPLADDGSIKADAMHYRVVAELDVLKGKIRLENPWPGKPVPPVAQPALFHFNSSFTEGRYYRRESCCLEKLQNAKWPAGIARFYATARYDIPYRVFESLKNMARPSYNRLFGTRPVAPGPR